MHDIKLRAVTAEDAAAILDIYSYYVEHTAVTFEYVTPSVEEFAGRIAATRAFFPYFAAEIDGRIVGYAYAGRFHPRAAYSWCAELSVYIHRDYHGRGIGRMLYAAAEEALSRMGILNLYACIAVPEVEDEYLTLASPHFHEHLGYTTIGEFHACGYKFGRWYNMIWMEKLIGEHGTDVSPVRSFGEI